MNALPGGVEPWRVAIERDVYRFGGLKVWMYRRNGAGATEVVQPAELVVTAIAPDEDGYSREPSLLLPEEFARALLDALAAYFGGSSELRRADADLKAERARVDVLIGHLAEMGRRP